MFLKLLPPIWTSSETVTSYISFCEDICIPTRTFLSFNNDKPWFTGKLKQLRQAKEDTYRIGDTILYNQARNRLTKEIRVAKNNYSEKLKKELSAKNDPASVWTGLRNITMYKTPPPQSVENQQLADDLNVFYCRFEKARLTPSTRSDLNFTHSPSPCKFADDTTVIGLIKDGDESAYRQEVEQLDVWCSLNNLELNTLKTVEMIVDFRRKPPALPPLTITDSTVAAVESFRFMVTTMDLKWDNHIDSIAKKAQQRLYFLRQLRKFTLPQELLKQFYSAINRVCPMFFYNCLVWFSYQNRHQKTTTDSQDCWEDYRCPSAQPPRTLHLQSEEKG